MVIIVNEWVFDGNHESTNAILDFMKHIDFTDKEVMDIGCGSGILAIKASELGAKHITALDFDSRAVDNTKENLERNGITNADVYWTDFMETDLKADIILANLPKDSSVFCMPKIKESLNDNGVLITSWGKDKTTNELFDGVKMQSHFKGIEYDVYILKKEKKLFRSSHWLTLTDVHSTSLLPPQSEHT